MTPGEARHLADIAVDVARTAGRVAIAGFREPKKVEHKGEIDLVTDFDTRTEEHIREQLAIRSPGVSIVAEEQGGEPLGDLVWYADPIDGTTNYAHGHPFWCVSIGAVERGVPVAGAVVAPCLGLEWTAFQGGPALRNGTSCRVSAEAFLGESMLATGFPYDRRTTAENNFDAFIALKLLAQGIRRCGSAAIDLCFVSDGTYDGYWERKLKPWDIAAGAVMVHAAGGRVSGFEGEPLEVGAGNLIASNGLIHEALMEELRRVKSVSR